MTETCNLSQALAIFSDNLQDIRKACIENIRDIQLKHLPCKEIDIDGDWTVENIKLHVNHIAIKEKTKHYLQTIKRIDGRQKHFTQKGITDEDIIRAKEVPLTELYEGQLFGAKRKYGLCPFHDERSPSFYIFPSNKFKCFGCQVYGTSIDFIMLRDGVDFIKAVKTLRGTI
jgi:hypothetical protein